MPGRPWLNRFYIESVLYVRKDDDTDGNGADNERDNACDQLNTVVRFMLRPE